MVLLAVATAGYTWVVGYIVDQANALNAQTGAIETARQYAALVLPVLLGLTALSGLSNYAQRILTNKVALNTVGDLQAEMFASAHGSDYAHMTREPIGNLVSKFTHDVTVLSGALIRALSNLIKDSLTILLTVTAMLLQNWSLTLLVVLLYPLAAWPIITISKRLRGNAGEVQAHIGQLTAELKESFSGARLVKTYGLEILESARLGKSFKDRIRLMLKLVTEQARVDPILEIMGGLAIAGVVIFGVYQVSAEIASAGSIAGVLTGLLILSPRIRALGTLNNVVQEGLAALTRMFAVIDTQASIIEAPQAQDLTTPRGDLSFDAVYFAYPDGTSALRGVTFTATYGQTVALVGASGSGKSTIINLIPRLYDVSAGQVMIDGTDIREVTLKSLRNSIALVSQDVTLFNASIAENIGFGDQAASRADIINAAKSADAHDFITALPEGYDTVLGEDGDTLSGGQKQRLSIARALLRDAPILLLDEATSALDANSEAKVQAALSRLTQGRTTLVIAHKLSTIQMADKILVLEDGKIVETGTHKTLSRKRGGTYARLRALQT